MTIWHHDGPEIYHDWPRWAQNLLIALLLCAAGWCLGILVLVL